MNTKSIWRARNKLFFENRVISAQVCITEAIRAASEWSWAQSNSLKTPATRSTPGAMHHINATAVSLFIDAAWSEFSNSAGLGWVFKSPLEGFFLDGTKAQKIVASPLQAEALAMREGLLQAKEKGLKSL